MLQSIVKHDIAKMNYNSIVLADNECMNPKKTVNTLANNLNYLMKLSGMDRKTLASKSGVSARMVAYICNAEKTATIETAEKLAEVFNLEGWHLIMLKLPTSIKETKHLKILIDNYIDSSSQGKDVITMIADREAKYKTGESK